MRPTVILDDDLLGRIEIPGTKPRTPSVREMNAAVHRALDNDDPLEEIIQRALDVREWYEEAAVVLIHVQTCECCGTRSEFSHGWFTEYSHRTDKHARRLAKGRPQGSWPQKVERVDTGQVPVCAACAESQILIEEAFRGS